jgi:hypothetical protein
MILDGHRVRSVRQTISFRFQKDGDTEADGRPIPGPGYVVFFSRKTGKVIPVNHGGTGYGYTEWVTRTIHGRKHHVCKVYIAYKGSVYTRTIKREIPDLSDPFKA